MTVVDLPLLLGGLLSSDPSTVFNVGHAIFVVAGVLVLPLMLALLWPLTPGHRFTFRGALVKGALWGVALFLFTGILLPLLAPLGHAPEADLTEPGLFGLTLGASGPIQLLLGIELSLSSAVVAGMARGLQPLDAVGWGWWSHGSGESP